jgi:hypothetical protein
LWHQQSKQAASYIKFLGVTDMQANFLVIFRFHTNKCQAVKLMLHYAQNECTQCVSKCIQQTSGTCSKNHYKQKKKSFKPRVDSSLLSSYTRITVFPTYVFPTKWQCPTIVLCSVVLRLHVHTCKSAVQSGHPVPATRCYALLHCMCSSSFLIPTAASFIACTNCFRVSGLPLRYNPYFRQPHRKKSNGDKSGDRGGHGTGPPPTDHFAWYCHWGTQSPLCRNVDVLCRVVFTFALLLHKAHPLSTAVVILQKSL